MRADRLLSLLLLLQSGRRQTADALARRLEVSVRTVYRDLDALSAAGVPVYASPGAGGGVALLEGWRLSLTGLTEREVQALSAAAAPAALEDLGLARELQSGLVKVAAALPALQQPFAEHARQRLHVDAGGWFGGARERVAHLGVLREGVWGNRRVRLAYRDFDGKASRRTVDPYALVLKADRWYLVAGTEKGPAVLRGSRIGEARLLEERFERPRDFDLPAFWKAWCARFAERRPSYRVTLRLTAAGAARLREVRPAGEDARWERPARDRVVVDFEREGIALAQLLPLGGGVEVLAPAALRERVGALACALTGVYGAADVRTRSARGSRASASRAGGGTRRPARP